MLVIVGRPRYLYSTNLYTGPLILDKKLLTFVVHYYSSSGSSTDNMNTVFPFATLAGHQVVLTYPRNYDDKVNLII